MGRRKRRDQLKKKKIAEVTYVYYLSSNCAIIHDSCYAEGCIEAYRMYVISHKLEVFQKKKFNSR